MKLQIDTQMVKDLLEDYQLLEESSTTNKTFEYLSYDSRTIQENTLFFCKGLNYKEEYLQKAIDAGATCYISEQRYSTDVDYFIVNDIRKAMAIIACIFYQMSFKDLETVGITGTKGKTTVTYFLESILNEHMKKQIAIISTVETITGARHEKSQLTTPEALELHKYFYEAKMHDMRYLIMEVSSQAYKIGRVEGVNFSHGLFLNVAEDHVSDIEHPTFEDYFSCKLALIPNCGDMLINHDMDYFKEVEQACIDAGTPYATYGSTKEADYYYDTISKTNTGLSFVLHHEQTKSHQPFSISMQGRFNVENASAAIITAQQLGVDDQTIQAGLLKTNVPGRMNIYEKDGITIIADYAHNGLSYKKLYESILLDYPGRRIITVAGGVGNKAYTRRKDFGAIVAPVSDYIYLTADDPQYEEVRTICDDMITYFPSGVEYCIIEDRQEAVETALSNAKSGDVIVLLAKGEEKSQIVNGKHEYYISDAVLAKQFVDGIEFAKNK